MSFLWLTYVIQQRKKNKATLEMKYVKSPSLCKEKVVKKSSRGQYGLRFSTDKSGMRGKRGGWG
jgi:hypothetical protein